jgi:hypothetical protein
MKAIDRLGWAAGLSFVAYGLRVGVRVNDPRELPVLLECLPPGWRPRSSPIVERLYSVILGSSPSRAGVRHFNLLYQNEGRLVRTRDRDALLETFEAQVRLYIAEAARNRIFVHAGVVGWGDHAIVIPGSSHSGKTRLVAELVRAGATYLSDEYAVLDRAGLVHPFPTRLALREPNAPARLKTPVEALGGQIADGPLPVGLVVACRFHKGSRWRPSHLSKGQAILAMLEHTVAARSRPEAAMTFLGKVVEAAPALKSSRGEARITAEKILEYVDARGANAA